MATKYGNEKKNRLAGRFVPETAQILSRIQACALPILLNVSLWEIARPWQVPERKIDDTLLWIVRSGNFVCRAAGRDFSLSAGQGIFIAAGETHSFRFAETCREGEAFILHLLYPLLPEITLPGTCGAQNFTLTHPEFFLSALMRSVAMRNHDRDSAFAGTHDLFRGLLLELAESGQIACAAGTGLRTEPRIAAAIHFLRTHFSENIGVPEMAEAVHLHEVQFRNLFGKTTGLSPYQYLLQYRLQKAAGMLSGTTLPLRGISAACGFRCTGNFCQAFRRHYAETPTEYRRRRQEL